MDPHSITPEQWTAFIRARSSGAIDARGKAVAEKYRKAVRARTVEADCQWLRFAFNWATEWRIGSRYLMRSNPIRGNAFAVLSEKNPRRPLATDEFFAAVRKAADSHTMQIRTRKEGTARGFDKVTVLSYLPELLDIVEGSARRIAAVCSLRYSVLKLAKSKHAAYGSIRWPGETDKEGREWSAPISPTVRAALNRVLKQRPAVGNGYLFPAPGNPNQPVSNRLVLRWLREAEKAAGLEPVPGQAWHSFRRKWATERKHLSDVDVAAAGGWKSLEALKRSYQHADEETVLAVVLGGKRHREANG